MIAGHFENGQPYVRAVLGIPRLGVHGTLRLLADTGAAVTCIHPRDGIPLHVPFDLLEDDPEKSIQGVGGKSECSEEHVTLSFIDANGDAVYVYRMAARLVKPEHASNDIPSVLGQDVLRRWLMVHDPANGRLEFHVREADEIFP